MGGTDTLRTGPLALGWTVMGRLAGLVWAQEDGLGDSGLRLAAFFVTS